jgi:glycosyltransferase involved in cell wall biosynthesis
MELVIGGIGVDESRLRTLANGDDRIKFLGFIPDNQLKDFYNSLDTFIMPTIAEGYGLPIVEAMACGKKVVVREDENIPVEVKERCIVVPNLGWYTLGQDLGIKVDIGDNYRWAKEHSWEKCIQEYVEVYKEVVDG